MLVSIEGDVGSGKTLLLTAMALDDSRMIYSNYPIKSPRYRELKPEMCLKLPYGGLITLDEAYAWLESRLSGRASNRYFSYVVFQSRKKGLDIIMTNQLIETVDVRFRKMVGLDIQCEVIDIGFEYTFQKVGRRRYYPPTTWILPFSEAEKIYPYYDSWEPVDSIEDDLIIKVTKDKKSIICEVDRLADELCEKYPIESITKGIVSDFCLRQDIPKSYVDLVANAIKARNILDKDD